MGQVKSGSSRRRVAIKEPSASSPHGFHGFCNSLTYALHPLVSLGVTRCRWVNDSPKAGAGSGNGGVYFYFRPYSWDWQRLGLGSTGPGEQRRYLMSAGTDC
jgi:hypothetical protein